MYPTEVKSTDHPDFVGGVVWSKLELEWIKQRDQQWKDIIASLTPNHIYHTPIPDSVKEESDWIKACKFCEEKFGDLVIQDNNPLAFTEGIDMLYFYKRDYIEPRYLTSHKVTIDGSEYRIALCNNPIKACFVPMETQIAHTRICNLILPMVDPNKRYKGLFNGSQFIPEDKWFNMPKGGWLMTTAGVEKVSPGTLYRVVENNTEESGIKLLVRMVGYPYPDRDEVTKYLG